jgi:hypothetical protein
MNRRLKGSFGEVGRFGGGGGWWVMRRERCRQWPARDGRWASAGPGERAGMV